MTYTRRNFLKATLGSSALLSLGTTAPNFLVRSMMAGAHHRNERDTVLVVVQLSGGNDGLNTVVPYEDDEYARNRPTLRLSPNEIHKINSHLGFHPRMRAFMRLYEEGHLSIIQGVGYPNTDRSHESGMRIWHTAAPNEPSCQTGWIGRTVDSIQEPSSINTPAVFVGPIVQPFGLKAKNAVIPSIDSLENLTMREMPGHQKYQSQRKRTAELPRPNQSNPLMNFLQQCTLKAYTNSRLSECTVAENSSVDCSD